MDNRKFTLHAPQPQRPERIHALVLAASTEEGEKGYLEDYPLPPSPSLSLLSSSSSPSLSPVSSSTPLLLPSPLLPLPPLPRHRPFLDARPIEALMHELHQLFTATVQHYDIHYSGTSSARAAQRHCIEDMQSSLRGFREKVQGTLWQDAGERIWSDVSYRLFVDQIKRRGRKDSQEEGASDDGVLKTFRQRHKMVEELDVLHWHRRNTERERRYGFTRLGSLDTRDLALLEAGGGLWEDWTPLRDCYVAARPGGSSQAEVDRFGAEPGNARALASLSLDEELEGLGVRMLESWGGRVIDSLGVRAMESLGSWFVETWGRRVMGRREEQGLLGPVGHGRPRRTATTLPVETNMQEPVGCENGMSAHDDDGDFAATGADLEASGMYNDRDVR